MILFILLNAILGKDGIRITKVIGILVIIETKVITAKFN